MRKHLNHNKFSNVSIQVQSVRYRSQTGHDPNGYNPVNYQHMHLIYQYQTKGRIFNSFISNKDIITLSQ